VEEIPRSVVTFLLEEDDIQVHIFGDHSWHPLLRRRLEALGVRLEEHFCSPCG
jgi:hypothetical protein